jgi:cytoskeletal protein RodZ
MRPSWDWGHGTSDVPSGTPGHTRELEEQGSLDEDESFFQAGDEGRYEGGPALLMTEEPVALDDETPVAVVARTPEQDARRARLVRVVAMAVGAFAALFAFGVVKQRKADAQEPTRPSAIVQPASQSQRRDVTPAVVAPPPPVAAPEPELDKTVAPEPKAEEAAPVVEKETKKPSVKASAFAAAVVEAPSAPAAKPVVTTTVTAVPVGQTTGTGNVGNFASKGPGSDVPRASMPTAAFPVQ